MNIPGPPVGKPESHKKDGHVARSWHCNVPARKLLRLHSHHVLSHLYTFASANLGERRVACVVPLTRSHKVLLQDLMQTSPQQIFWVPITYLSTTHTKVFSRYARYAHVVLAIICWPVPGTITVASKIAWQWGGHTPLKEKRSPDS